MAEAALDKAINTGNPRNIETLVAQYGVQIFESYTNFGERKETALHRAINQAQTEVALNLLQNKKSVVQAMVTHQDFRGETPLHRCGWCGRYEIARRLLNFGEIVNTPNLLGLTALHLAAERGIL